MRKSMYLGAASLAVLFANPAVAQETDEVEDGDIVVTANRFESLMSDTPIAMSAFTGDDLTQSGVTNPTQLADSVPNVSIVRGNGLQITIRGVTSTDGTEKGDPSAAFMLDGIYLARPQAQEVSFFDIERVEVLRGPQGTLYGRNSTAGVINVLSARPEFEFSGSVNASYGSFDHLNGTAVINIPLGETFAVRAAANIDRRDSFLIDGNTADGVTLDPFKDNQSLRLSALFEPSEDFSLLLVGDYSTIQGNPTNAVPSANFFSVAAAGVRANYTAPVHLDPANDVARRLSGPQAQQAFRDNVEYGIMGELNWDFGPASLTYLGSYRVSDRLEFSNIANGAFSADFFGDYWQTSHEVRLAFGEGPLQAQVGGYYFKEKSGIGFFINNLLAPNSRFGFPQDPTISENHSVFGQATYEILPDLRITGGLRYSHDLKSRVGNTVLDIYDSVTDSSDIGNLIVRNIFQDNDASRTFSKVTWRAGIDYDSPLGLIFASVSTGYKAGGFNDGCEIGDGPRCNLPPSTLYYDPETLTAYEAGFKFDVADGVRLNGTIFHYDYRGLQISQVANLCGGPCQVTTNAAVAEVNGIELDVEVRPTDGLTLRGAVNVLDAQYSTFNPSYNIGTDAAPIFVTVDFSGRELNRSPNVTWSAGINYVLPLGDGELVADAGIRGSSSYELTDIATLVFFYQPSYTKTDLSLTYRGADDAWNVGVFVENLENNLVLTSAAFGQFDGVSFADPRQFGIRVGASF